MEAGEERDDEVTEPLPPSPVRRPTRGRRESTLPLCDGGGTNPTPPSPIRRPTRGRRESTLPLCDGGGTDPTPPSPAQPPSPPTGARRESRETPLPALLGAPAAAAAPAAPTSDSAHSPGVDESPVCLQLHPDRPGGEPPDASIAAPTTLPPLMPQSPWNRNVIVALAFTFWSSAGRGVWAFATLSVYLKLLKGSGLGVGIAEGAQGLAQVLVAPLCGYFGDKVRRDALLVVAAVIGTIAAIVLVSAIIFGTDLSASALALSDTERYWMLLGGLSLWGAYQGAWTTGLETIYADSVPAGCRSLFNVYKFAALQTASMVGPLVSVVLYVVLGNHWRDGSGSSDSASGSSSSVEGPVSHVMLVGVCMCVPAAWMLCFFSDEHSIRETRKASVAKRVNSLESEKCGDAAVRQSSTEQVEAEAAVSVSVHPTSVTKQVSWGGKPDMRNPTTDEDESASTTADPCVSHRHIPHIIVASDMISGFGSGMTIKFFPLFFDEAMGLSPVEVNLIYVGLPLVLTAGSFGAQRLSRSVGRVDASMLCGLIGALALAGLWVLGRGGWPAQRKFWYTALPLYLVSTAQHCCRPLKKSILMDHVPRAERARWNSVDSVTRFGWSGSAVVGGFVVDRWGYGASFLVTAVLQCLSVWCLGLLRPLIQREEMAIKDETPPPSPWGDDRGSTLHHAFPTNDSFDTFFSASMLGPGAAHSENASLLSPCRHTNASPAPRMSLSRYARSEAHTGAVSLTYTARTNASRLRREVNVFAHSYRSGLTTTTAELDM